MRCAAPLMRTLRGCTLLFAGAALQSRCLVSAPRADQRASRRAGEGEVARIFTPHDFFQFASTQMRLLQKDYYSRKSVGIYRREFHWIPNHGPGSSIAALLDAIAWEMWESKSCTSLRVLGAQVSLGFENAVAINVWVHALSVSLQTVSTLHVVAIIAFYSWTQRQQYRVPQHAAIERTAPLLLRKARATATFLWSTSLLIAPRSSHSSQLQRTVCCELQMKI